MTKNQRRASEATKRRREAKRKGLCGMCSSKKPSVGKKTCEDCLERARKRDRVPGPPFCVPCLAFHKRCPPRAAVRLLRAA